MQTDHLNLLRTAAETGSFAAAAQRHDLDPSLVSRRISALEKELGFQLFARTTRSITLTEAGQAYLARIAPLLDDLDDAANAARDVVDRPRGTLRISASTAFGQTMLLPMLPGFLDQHPDIRLELLFDDRPVDLVAERIDLAIRMSPDAPPDTIVRRLITTRYRVVASPGWAQGNPLQSPPDLAGMGALTFAIPGFRDTWRFRDRDGKETEVPITSRIELTGALAIAEAARQGLGPALLADWLIRDDLASGRLIDLFPGHDVTATSFDTAAWLLYPGRGYLPLKARLFMDALVQAAATPASGAK